MGSSRRAVPLVRPHTLPAARAWPWMTAFRPTSPGPTPSSWRIATSSAITPMARRASGWPGPATRATHWGENIGSQSSVMAGMVAGRDLLPERGVLQGRSLREHDEPVIRPGGGRSLGHRRPSSSSDRLSTTLSARGGRRSGLAVSPESRFRSRKRGIAPTHMLGYEPR